MEFLVSLNENYLLPAGVLLCSLFENNKEEEVNVHLFLGEGKDGFWQPLCDLCQKYHQQVSLYHLNETNTLGKMPGMDLSRYPLEAYNRLFMTMFLPEEIHKVIYLDCDMVVCENLHSLWEENIDEYAVGAVDEYAVGAVDEYTVGKRVGYDAKYGYFNSGMLLVNLDYWRNNNVTSLFVEYIKNNPQKLRFADQDVLNSIFYDNKKNLPIRYNLTTDMLRNDLQISSEYFAEIDAAYQNPTIIHFIMPDRPWFKNNKHPLRHYWEQYRDLTIWEGQFMERKRAKRTVKSILHSARALLNHLIKFHSMSIYNKKYLN